MSEKKKETSQNAHQTLAVFEDAKIRRAWHDNEWWFSVADVCAVLTASTDAGAYWRKLKQRLTAESGQPVTFCHGLKLVATDGKQRVTDAANTEGLFRLIQSIPSPKAEPFKRWLAKVGYERIQEIDNPELASARARELYETKGYPKAWIEKRLRSIAIRGELTGEWKQRGVQEGKEYAILTAEIARATFGIGPAAHSALKQLDKVRTGNNLRDHMTDLELIFSMLGEASTTEITRHRNAQGFPANRASARAGGTIAGDARQALEAKTGKPVISASNHLALQQTTSQRVGANCLPPLSKRASPPVVASATPARGKQPKRKRIGKDKP